LMDQRYYASFISNRNNVHLDCPRKALLYWPAPTSGNDLVSKIPIRLLGGLGRTWFHLHGLKCQFPHGGGRPRATEIGSLRPCAWLWGRAIDRHFFPATSWTLEFEIPQDFLLAGLPITVRFLWQLQVRQVIQKKAFSMNLGIRSNSASQRTVPDHRIKNYLSTGSLNQELSMTMDESRKTLSPLSRMSSPTPAYRHQGFARATSQVLGLRV